MLFIHFVRENHDIQSFIFWADYCSAQNKNWFLFTALANKVNRKNTAIHAITLKYFEPGHTFMSADSFRHRTEQKIWRKIRLEYFQDFVDVADTCEQSIVMNYASWCIASKIHQSSLTRAVKECFGKHHTHKKNSTMLNFFKEGSLKVAEMISSELKSPEV